MKRKKSSGDGFLLSGALHLGLLLSGFIALTGTAHAESVKLGVLTDLSSVYAEFLGQGRDLRHRDGD